MPTGHYMLRVPGTLAGVTQAAADLRLALDRCRVTGRARYHAELVFEEVTTNVIRHGRRDDAAPVIDVSLACGGDTVVLTFEDDGRPFDPLQRPDPVRPASLEAAPLGGLGIMLVRRVSRDIRYERTGDDRNRLTVTIAAASAPYNI